MAFYYVCFDPGTTHFAAAIVKDLDDKLTLEYEETFDIRPTEKKEHCPSLRLADRACRTVMARLYRLISPHEMIRSSCRVFVEQQPCIRRGGPNTLRNNAWSEGFVLAFFQALNIPVHDSLCPNEVKCFFKIRSGDYATNKALAVREAEKILGTKMPSDHVADCVLLAAFAHAKRFR